jgi:ABC-type Na+ transport system ATPase subunit NatA
MKHAGDISCRECWQMLQADKSAQLVDVRTSAEWNFVGVPVLRDLGREHTILFSSHLLGEVETLVSRVVILRRGHLALDKRIEELREEANRERTLRFEVRGEAFRTAVLGLIG